MSDHQPTRVETAEAIREAAREVAATLNRLANRIAHRTEAQVDVDPAYGVDEDPEIEVRQVMWEGEPVHLDRVTRPRDVPSAGLRAEKMNAQFEADMDRLAEEARKRRRAKLDLIGCYVDGCPSEITREAFGAVPGWRFIIKADGTKHALCPEHRVHVDITDTPFTGLNLEL